MDDNLDIYDTVDTLKECQYTYPGRARKFFDYFSRTYTIAVQSLDPPLYAQAIEIIVRDFFKLDIICGNLKINEKESAVSCLREIIETKIEEGLSLTALELETQKALGVIVIQKRKDYSTVFPDRSINVEMDKDILFIEEIKCLLLNRTFAKIESLGWVPGEYLEVCAICGSRETTDFSNVEKRLMACMVRMAREWKIIYSLIVITGYKKHQDVLRSLGCVKLAEIAYATINRKFEEKIFSNVGASPTIMSLVYRLDHLRRLRPRYPFKPKEIKPRPQRFNFWFA